MFIAWTFFEHRNNVDMNRMIKIPDSKKVLKDKTLWSEQMLNDLKSWPDQKFNDRKNVTSKHNSWRIKLATRKNSAGIQNHDLRKFDGLLRPEKNSWRIKKIWPEKIVENQKM